GAAGRRCGRRGAGPAGASRSRRAPARRGSRSGPGAGDRGTGRPRRAAMTRGPAREVAVQPGLRKAALLTAALLLALAFGVRDAAAQAITFDSASNAIGNAVSSLTWAHTVGAGNNRIL